MNTCFTTSSGNNDIIVATPGRMVGHLKETPGFSDQMKGNRTVSVTKLSLNNVQYCIHFNAIPHLQTNSNNILVHE